MPDVVRIAILGLGSVGRALARAAPAAGLDIGAAADSSGGVLLRDRAHLERVLRAKEAGAALRDCGGCDLHPDAAGFVASLRPAGLSVAVECLPSSLRDGQPGIRLIETAFSAGLQVVTIDKGPPVHAFEALANAARTAGVRFAYSGATGVRLPHGLEGSAVEEIRGVLNGTTNYILTRMQQDGLSFSDALAVALELGIAEPDPSSDLEGWDTVCKILILAKACMGADTTLEEVSRTGIGPRTEALVTAARQTGRVVRLAGRAWRHRGRVRVSVAPEIVGAESPFFGVSGTSKSAVFRTAEGEIQVCARSGREEIARTIIEDIFDVAGLR